MQRANVCVRSVTVSDESHLRLVKVKELQPEIADHEAAYLDNTGTIYMRRQVSTEALTDVRDAMTCESKLRSDFIHWFCAGKTNVLSREDWWQLLVSCVLTLCEVKRYEEAELMVESAMEFYSFYDNKPLRKELEFFGLSATILDRNHYNAYNYIR